MMVASCASRLIFVAGLTAVSVLYKGGTLQSPES